MKITKILLVLAIGLFGLSACIMSGAQKEIAKNSSTPTPQTPPSPEKSSKPETANSNKLSAEDIKNGSVKSDDYDDNMKDGKNLCDVEAFVVDKDPKGLNIRGDGNANAKIIGKIPLDEEGTTVHITGANYGGWMIIDHAENVSGKTVFKGKGWVSANMLATSTTGYGTEGVKLYETDGGAKILTLIPSEEVVKISACNQKYVQVKYKNFTGWLDIEGQCPNPVTNCS